MTFKKIFFSMFFLFSFFLQAQTRIVVTLPEFKEIFDFIGQEKVMTQALLTGKEDPHYVDAVPSFISKVAKADIVCAVGLELEVGWLPKVLSKSANAKVQKGGPGFCELNQGVSVIEKHTGPIDRSMGDVHAGGNPHYYLSPTALISVARNVSQVLAQQDPQNRVFFQNNLGLFEKKMNHLKQLVATKLNSFRNVKLIQFHKEFSYFLNEYNLSSFGAIEEKPGVPPSSARIARVALNAKQSKVQLALSSYHSPKHYLKKFSEISKIPSIKLPASVQIHNPKLNNIEKVQLHIADQLQKALTPLNRTAVVR